MYICCLQHAEICRFPSTYFYKEKLQTDQLDREEHSLTIWPNDKFPMVFCHVEGTEVTQPVTTPEGNERSKSNKEEIDHVVRLDI